MKITLDLPKNKWNQPTEIRKELVEQICKHIINVTCDNKFNDFILIRDNNPCVYYMPNVEYAFNCIKEGNNIRITTIEMETIFKAVQEAGYFIFYERHSNGDNKFHFTKKPYYQNHKCTKIEFNLFID